MALLNHLLISLIVAFLVGGFFLIVGLLVFRNSKKIVAEFSATIFILCLFLMFIPYVQNDVTSRAVYPLQNTIQLDGRTTEEISFSLNKSLDSAYVRGDCENVTGEISFYGYSSYLGREDGVQTIIEENASTGVYNCVFHLCKSPRCDNIIMNKSSQVRVN